MEIGIILGPVKVYQTLFPRAISSGFPRGSSFSHARACQHSAECLRRTLWSSGFSLCATFSFPGSSPTKSSCLCLPGLSAASLYGSSLSSAWVPLLQAQAWGCSSGSKLGQSLFTCLFCLLWFTILMFSILKTIVSYTLSLVLHILFGSCHFILAGYRSLSNYFLSWKI